MFTFYILSPPPNSPSGHILAFLQSSKFNWNREAKDAGTAVKLTGKSLGDGAVLFTLPVSAGSVSAIHVVGDSCILEDRGPLM